MIMIMIIIMIIIMIVIIIMIMIIIVIITINKQLSLLLLLSLLGAALDTSKNEILLVLEHIRGRTGDACNYDYHAYNVYIYIQNNIYIYIYTLSSSRKHPVSFFKRFQSERQPRSCSSRKP